MNASPITSMAVRTMATLADCLIPKRIRAESAASKSRADGRMGRPVRALKYPAKPNETVAAPTTPLKVISQPIKKAGSWPNA